MPDKQALSTGSGQAFGFGTPFEAQLEFFRNKLNLPTERWNDIVKAAHDRAFIVAGAAEADLLNDLHAAILKCIAEGGGLESFRKDFAGIVQRRGWTGWTGEGTKAGVAWRTKVIYQTNMATSYAAGRWQQLKNPDLLKLMPYWQYHHRDNVTHPRPLHVAWDGLTLPHDHPFWDTHFPPNGWGCHCWVSAADKEEYVKAQTDGKGEPPDGWDAISPKTGAQVGIDQGFDYAPGANVLRTMKDFIDQKLINLDAPIGAAMWEELAPVLAAEQATAVRKMVAAAAASMEPAGESVVVHVVAPATVVNLAKLGVVLNDAAVWLRDHELVHSLRDYKDARGAVLPLDVWLNFTRYIDNALPYYDTVDGRLLYVFDLPDQSGKFAVRINYTKKVRADGGRKNTTSNFIVTGGTIEQRNLNEKTIDGVQRFEPLAK